MNTFAELARLIENLLRYGTVHAVQLNPPRVQIKTGQLITDWLPWLALRAGQTKRWNPPTVGEQVLLLSPSGVTTAGLALIGIYSDQNPAPSTNGSLDLTTYPDGAVLEYNNATHALKALLPAGATVTITANGGLTITGDITLNGTLNATGDVVADGVSLKAHTHPGDSGGTTGAPN